MESREQGSACVKWGKKEEVETEKVCVSGRGGKRNGDCACGDCVRLDRKAKFFNYAETSTMHNWDLRMFFSDVTRKGQATLEALSFENTDQQAVTCLLPC